MIEAVAKEEMKRLTFELHKARQERDRYRQALEAIVESNGKLAPHSIAHDALRACGDYH